MDYYFKLCFVIINVISLVFVANAVPSTRNLHIVHHNLREDLAAKFCQGTQNPTLCAQTIGPHFLHRAIDPFKALEIEVEATLAQVKKTASVIAGLLAKHDINKSLRGSLDTCKSQYGMILDAIGETKSAIAKHDIIEAKFKFSAVLSYQASCTDDFQGMAIPFASDSSAVFDLGGNCLDIIAAMEKTMVPPHPLPVQSTPSAFSNVIGTIS